MISFNRLGNLGHLGNQMFQYASLKGIASKNNTEFCFPEKKYFGKEWAVRSFIDDCFNLKCKREITQFQSVMEPFFCFDERFFNIQQDLDIFGYFQSEKYFVHIEDEIRKDFTFKEDILSPCVEMISELSDGKKKDFISLHIRRTDYTSNPNHPVQSLDYYKKALSNFDDQLSVIVFSDDFKWCNEQELFSSDRFLISESDNCYVDLCLMSLCTYHIIANSSFSWWGSWLAKSKKTIAPSYWFDGDCKKHDTKDLYLKEWVVL